MTTRRRGGVPPIVTVLITISAVVAAAIAAYFLFSTTSSATKTPMLEVTSAYALCTTSGTTTTCTVYVTLRNVGTVTIQSIGTPNIYVSVSGTSQPVQGSCPPPPSTTPLPAGGSVNLKCSVSANIPDGASAVLEVTVTPEGAVSSHTLSIGFKIARP